ncbi:MAG: AAA domain-containing protein [Kiritimatiellae bacterium]|nr:AAA domain-containing protein [Kiritimatiellia bacterium]
MNDTLTNYTLFFKDQINEMLLEYRRLLRAPIKQLVAAGQVHYAVVHGVSNERGHVVFRLDRKYSPRLKVQKSMVLIKRAARERWGENPQEWECSFEEFLCKEEFHTSSSLALPLYYLPSSEDGRILVGCGAVSLRMFSKIKGALERGIRVHVFLYDVEPPTRYLANLVDYMQGNPADGVLMSRQLIRYDDWKPELLAYSSDDRDCISRTLLSALAKKSKVVLQGPPGTGKSFCAAQIIADYLARGQSVCVTALTNKALLELITQPPLSKYVGERRISKTMLTSDEAVQVKCLKNADADYVAPKGEALFATYYKISGQFRSISPRQSVPMYDLVVVEEASQAYLTTIAASLRLGRDVLIVGDPMQLAPIVISEDKPEYKRWNAVTQAEGLLTFVLGNEVASYRITTTFRLSAASASLTSVFYGGELRSVSPRQLDWSHLDGKYFPAAGGVVVDVLTGGEDGVLSVAAAKVIEYVLGKIEGESPSASVAIITPFKETVKAIQRRYSFEGRKLNVSVETIDRVQGATVDYTILYFPLRNVAFALNERRFNVATSRSRSTTLILSDYELLEMRSVTGKVREFLERVEGVCRDVLPEPIHGCQSAGVVPREDNSCVARANISEMAPTLADIQRWP